MRYAALLAGLCYGVMAFGSPDRVPLGEEKDGTAPPVKLEIPEQPKTPLLQPYVTDTGKKAELVTPDVLEPYAIIPRDDEGPDPLDNSDETNTDSQWQLLSW